MRIIALAILFISIPVMALTVGFDGQDSNPLVQQRVFTWIQHNQVHTIFRFEILNIKEELERHKQGRVDDNNVRELLSAVDIIKGGEQKFFLLAPDDYCLTGYALEYILQSWMAQIAEMNGESELSLKHEAGMNEILEIDWYRDMEELTGLFMYPEKVNEEVDIAAKKYAKEFARLQQAEDFDLKDTMQMKAYLKRYLLKPFCTEPPIVDMVLDKVLFFETE